MATQRSISELSLIQQYTVFLYAYPWATLHHHKGSTVITRHMLVMAKRQNGVCVCVLCEVSQRCELQYMCVCVLCELGERFELCVCVCVCVCAM